MGLAFRFAVSVGIGFLGVLPLFGCAATAPPSEHLATSPPIAVPQARTSQSGADAEIDPDCPYLTFNLVTPSEGKNVDERRASYEIQRPYMEEFSAHLERVGFRAWEPSWVRVERAGLTETGAYLKRLFQLGSADLTKLSASESAELERIAAKLTKPERARIWQIVTEIEMPTWAVTSNVLEITELSELFSAFSNLPNDIQIVWAWTMRKVPTVLEGALRVDRFTDPSDDDRDRYFESISGHQHVVKSEFGMVAARAAGWAAAVFLPHARQLCADLNATLLEEEKALERIRDQLNEEIIRIRERRAEQEKRLELEVEQ